MGKCAFKYSVRSTVGELAEGKQYLDGLEPKFPTHDWISAEDALPLVASRRAVIVTYKPYYGAEYGRDLVPEWERSRKAKTLMAQKAWSKMPESERLLRAWMELGGARMYKKDSDVVEPNTNGAPLPHDDTDHKDEENDSTETVIEDGETVTRERYEHTVCEKDEMYLVLVPTKFEPALIRTSYDGSEDYYLDSARLLEHLVSTKIQQGRSWTKADHQMYLRDKSMMTTWDILRLRDPQN